MLIKIGKAYDRERNYREAALFFERAMKADLQSAQAAFRLGWVYVKEGSRKEEGIKLMRRSLQMENGHVASSYSILGDLLMREGSVEQLDDAVDFL